MESLFFTWLDTMRGKGQHDSFYYHTDLEALEAITTYVKRRHPELPGTNLIDLTDVPEWLQRDVLEALYLGKHQGCAHLRLLMNFPQKYGVDLKMVRYLIKAYFNLLWRKDLPGL